MPALVVTVNVEPDRPRGDVQARTSTRNLQGLTRLNRLCERFGVPVTYLVAYPVAADARTKRLDRFAADGAEMGALLLPWTTPPFEANEDRLVPHAPAELPASAIALKLAQLTETITERFGRPKAHRAAALGLNGALLQSLERLEYMVDSTVAPFVHAPEHNVDWRTAPEAPYFPDRQSPARRGASPVLQVPRTVGWSHDLLPSVARALVKVPTPIRDLARQASERIPLPEICWMDPSRTATKPLRRLARTIAERGLPVLNLTLHSTHCWPGESRANPDSADVEAMFERLEATLRFIVDDLRATPQTLSQFAHDYIRACG